MNALTFREQAATGSITWDNDWPLVSNAPPPLNTCRAAVKLVDALCVERKGPPTVDLKLVVACTDQTGTSNELELDLGDLPNFKLGTSSMPGYYWADDWKLDTTISIVSRTGGEAPYPEVATPDFDEVVQVDFTSGTVASKTVHGSLRFELNASQFGAEPNKPCTLCLC